ncbi:MAG: RIP metalloprotease RseP [Bacillota bacterium]
MLTTIVVFIIFLGVLIFVHELGHFIMAKKSDIRVEEFALGFGPKLISRKKGETVFSIRLIPLGGFCNMVGEMPVDKDDLSEEEVKLYEETVEQGRAFHQKSPGKRLLVLAMGAIMNFILALVAFILIFSFYGLPVDYSSEAVIGQAYPNHPAAEAELRSGDKILAIDGQDVESWEEMASYIHDHPGEPLEFTVQRNGNEMVFEITPRYDESAGHGIIGVEPDLIRERVGPITAIQGAVTQTGYVMKMTFNGFVQIFAQRNTEDLGGPVMIASIVGRAARTGFDDVLNWLAIISINLGILNLLPFPALDGGRIVFVLIEMIVGKPVPQEKEGFIHMIGFFLLILLMVFVIYQDIITSFF